MFTQTRVEIADLHTTLHYFLGPKPASPPLPLGGSDSFLKIYAQAAGASRRGGLSYQEASDGRPAKVFRVLKAFCSEEKFWTWYLGTASSNQYAALAWDYLFPIEVSLTPRVEYLPNPAFPCTVSPILRVLLFPFGWSSWLSLRINGNHDLTTLASFVQRLFNDKVFALDASASPVTLRQLLRRTGEDTMSDAFGGDGTRESSKPDEFLTIVTVTGKGQGSLSSTGLSTAEQALLKRILNPAGAPSGEPFENLVHELTVRSPEPGAPPQIPHLDFVCADGLGRFTYFYALLVAPQRSLQHLQCYHFNTFRSCLLALHQSRLLEASLRQTRVNAQLRNLIRNAVARLGDSASYKSASLRFLLDSADLKAAQSSAKARWRL